jgi:5-hydroxyisourate hydrolase
VSQITTHVLDTSLGRPAAGVLLLLEMKQPQGNWKELGRGVTDADGRCRQLLTGGALAAGTYRLIFDTASYFQSCKISGFYPRVSIEFEVRDSESHYHVPLLLSPYGYSTYRGS